MHMHVSKCVQMFACACVSVNVHACVYSMYILYICTTYTYSKGQRGKGRSHDLDKRGKKITNVLRLTFDGAG